ncbi:MAG: hypothetical protein AAFY26_27825, partial [Cyanobacteria bacterium J06638_22]
QDRLWTAYTKARDATDDPNLQVAFSDIYDALMRHFEGCYYSVRSRQRLSDSELQELKRKLASILPAAPSDSPQNLS